MKLQKNDEYTKNGKVRITNNRFCCENCGGISIFRNSQNGDKKLKFKCKNCQHKSTHIYDKKQGESVNFEEYFKIMNKEANTHKTGERWDKK